MSPGGGGNEFLDPCFPSPINEGAKNAQMLAHDPRHIKFLTF